MNRRSILAFCILSALLFNSFSFSATKSKQFATEEEGQNYLTTHYNVGCQYYNQQNWRRSATEFEKVIYFFPSSDAAAEASYYLAVCYFEMKEYDFANEEFSNYLKASQHPAFFEDAVYYKFCIAEYFKAGTKRRPFKMRYLPKWISAQDLALTVYDEVVIALPNHPLTIQALYAKADLLRCMGEYRDAIETYQIIIRRFPKDEIVPACYLNISETYYQQSRYQFQNPDLLALAELNVRKFKEDFPRDERVIIAQDNIYRIKELYAKGLCDLGLFYERMKQPAAAAIYYQSSIEEFPDTRVSQFCFSRLQCLGYSTEAQSTEEPVQTSLEEVPAPIPEQQAPIPEQPESFPEQEQSFISKAVPPADDLPPVADVAPNEEYQHYSIMKNQQATHVPFEPVDEQVQETCLMEGNFPQDNVDDPHLAEDAPFIMHYSQMKHRDQKRAAPRE